MMGKKRAILASLVLLATPQAALSENAWSFKVLPYIWMSGLTGDVASLPGTPPASIDVSFIDVLENRPRPATESESEAILSRVEDLSALVGE